MRRRIATIGLACVSACGAARAQQSIGSVGVADATVAGALEVSNGRAMLLGASTVTAKDHTAEVALNRGGTVKVCSTSGLHLTAGKGAVDAPLMLALDRGAIEVAARVTTSDVVMTPDLRFTMKSAGPLDLQVRVARNGDTCVENRGAAAPVVSVADQFGESSYEIKAGQHVLFEHGSLKEVVDNEHEPCGCPPAPIVSVADAGVSAGAAAAPGSAVATTGAAKTAAEQHPFPAAVSAGLAPAGSAPTAPAGVVHAQVSTTMSYGESGSSDGAGGDAGSAASTASAAKSAVPSSAASASATPAVDAAPHASAETNASATAAKAEAPPAPPAPPSGDVFHAIGRFFKKMFGGH
ncbi:hypothetical protein [Edaphobacter aggregans]|uniref:hypothetical protein n=1 Tax=Edaphobacter aggregans TaxID=570835 RepID=UPI00068FC67A|nr:hypothetical protein [Edaphobacter aggregans]